MAADILLYDAHLVPVGKDQVQHLEIAADIAKSFNNQTGQEIFVVPQAKTDERVMIVPGIDGQKMSKSYNNFINIFLPEKELKKVVMSIVTDSKSLEDKKDPSTDNVFKIFKLLAPAQEVEEMKNKYEAGGFGYGHAKQALLDVILKKYKNEREQYAQLMADPDRLEKELTFGEQRAAALANKKLKQVRDILGYR